MYGCGEQEVVVASGSGWNLWVWLLGVVVRRYIDFLIQYTYPTPLVSVLFCSSIPTFCSFKKCFLRNRTRKIKDKERNHKTTHTHTQTKCSVHFVSQIG